MDPEAHTIAHRYISIEWARKTMEHDLKRIQTSGLKYPKLFEETAVQVLNRLSIQMRDLKKEMHDRGIKVVYRGRTRKLYDAFEYDLFIGMKQFNMKYGPEILKQMAFEELEKASGIVIREKGENNEMDL